MGELKVFVAMDRDERPPNVAFRWLTFLLRVLEVQGWNLRLETCAEQVPLPSTSLLIHNNNHPNT